MIREKSILKKKVELSQIITDKMDGMEWRQDEDRVNGNMGWRLDGIEIWDGDRMEWMGWRLDGMQIWDGD